MGRERHVLIGRAFAALLAELDRFDEREGVLTPIERVRVVTSVAHHLTLGIVGDPCERVGSISDRDQAGE